MKSVEKEKMLNMKVRDLSQYRSVIQCAKDLGYHAHGIVGDRIRELDLGIDFADLGITCMRKSVKILSPEDFETLKESLANKKRTGRKPRNLDKIQ